MLICLDTMCFALCQLEKYSGKEMHSPWEQTQIKSNNIHNNTKPKWSKLERKKKYWRDKRKLIIGKHTMFQNDFLQRGKSFPKLYIFKHILATVWVVLFVLCLCFGSLPDYFKLNLGEGMRENSQRKYLKSNEWRVNLPDSESMIIKIRWFGSKYWQEDKWNIMNVAESTQVCIKNSIW